MQESTRRRSIAMTETLIGLTVSAVSIHWTNIEQFFAKGILDAADAAYTLEAWEPDDKCMTFNCTKMRNNEVKGFSSEVDWSSLKIGPNSTLNPKEKAKMREDMGLGEGEEVQEI